MSASIRTPKWHTVTSAEEEVLQVAGHWMSHDGSMVQHTTGVFVFLLLTLYMVHSNSYIIHMKSHFKMVFNLGRAKILGKRRLKLFRDYFIPKAATFLGFDFFFFQMSHKVVF